MELPNKRKAITEFHPIIKCKKSKEVPETYTFAEDVMNLVAEIRKIPDGANVKDLFLFELLLNAQFALHLVWKDSLIDKKKYEDAHSLEICIIPDEKNKTLSLVDNGIGMTRDELINNLSSSNQFFQGPRRHLDTINKYLAYEADVNLSHIYKKKRCNLGLGFFSAYMVADKVVVTTRVQGDDPFVWECKANDKNGISTFSVVAADLGDDSFVRGTKVTLHLKPGNDQYLSMDKLQELVNRKSVKLFHLHPILVLPNGKKERGILLNVKKREEPIEKLKQQYEDIRLLFVKYVSERAKNVDVVISDRPEEVFCNLDVFEDGCKRPVLEINPRCDDEMKELRKKMLECVESLSVPKQKKTKKKEAVSYTKKKEDALKRLIMGHFIQTLNRIRGYDFLNGTSFFRKAEKAIALDGCGEQPVFPV